jgi:hypothetical protein
VKFEQDLVLHLAQTSSLVSRTMMPRQVTGVGLIPASVAAVRWSQVHAAAIGSGPAVSKTCSTSPPSGFLSISKPNLNGATQWVAGLAHFSVDGSAHTVITKSSAFAGQLELYNAGM